jgi:hypothetical protein
MYFPYSGKRLNIISAITHFYILEELSLQNPPISLLQRRRWNEYMFEVNMILSELTEKMARTIFDYLCVSSLGEARHAKNQARRYYIQEFQSHNQGRESVYNHAFEYNPVQFLPILKKVFLRGMWPGGGFGGVKWGNIVNAALMYGTVPDKIFIDHVVNICHNGGTAFDKGVIVYLSGRSSMHTILATKFVYKSFIEALILLKIEVELSPFILRTIKRMGEFDPYFNNLQFVNCNGNVLTFPSPIFWGNETISIVKKSNSIEDSDFYPEVLYADNTLDKKDSQFEKVLESTIKSVSYILNSIKTKIDKIENSNEPEIEEEPLPKLKIKVGQPTPHSSSSSSSSASIISSTQSSLSTKMKKVKLDLIQKDQQVETDSLEIDSLIKKIKKKEEQLNVSDSKKREE